MMEIALAKIMREIFRGMKFSDFVFLCVLVANLILVGYLGVGDYRKGESVALLQKNGEQILLWFGEFSQKLEINESISQKSCIPLAESEIPGRGVKVNTWQACVSSLFDNGGPFQDFSNLLMPNSPAYAAKCDKHELGTSGAFIFEKMTLNPAGPPAVSPMEPSEKLFSGMNIRLSLCDSGYYLIKIGEFKL